MLDNPITVNGTPLSEYLEQQKRKEIRKDFKDDVAEKKKIGVSIISARTTKKPIELERKFKRGKWQRNSEPRSISNARLWWGERHTIMEVKSMKPIVITGQEKQIIDYMIQSETRLSRSDLAERMKFSNQHMSVLLNKLEERGLIVPYTINGKPYYEVYSKRKRSTAKKLYDISPKMKMAIENDLVIVTSGKNKVEGFNTSSSSNDSDSDNGEVIDVVETLKDLKNKVNDLSDTISNLASSLYKTLMDIISDPEIKIVIRKRDKSEKDD